jgi:hypothetical protein
MIRPHVPRGGWIQQIASDEPPQIGEVIETLTYGSARIYDFTNSYHGSSAPGTKLYEVAVRRTGWRGFWDWLFGDRT